MDPYVVSIDERLDRNKIYGKWLNIVGDLGDEVIEWLGKLEARHRGKIGPLPSDPKETELVREFAARLRSARTLACGLYMYEDPADRV